MKINVPGAELVYDAEFLTREESDQLLAELVRDVPWEQRDVVVHGKTWPQPRLTAWYGPAAYTYSGLTLDPHPLTPAMQKLQERIEAITDTRYNSLLLNRYVAGKNHGIGAHADNEKELGRDPIIAMVSLGEERALRFEPARWNTQGQPFSVPCAHGSLTIMGKGTQRNWRHGVPKAVGRRDRVTLTLRSIQVG